MESLDEPLFVSAPFFMIRTPLFSIQEFFKLFDKKLKLSLSLFTESQLPLVREAIAVASSSLYKAMIDKKENDQTHASLLKYFSRMTTRSTPFGLFSFVSMGSWGQSTSVEFDLTKIQKRVRPDMEWLFAVIDQLSSNPQLHPFLLVKRNPLIFESIGRTCLNYYRKKKGEEEAKTVSVRSSFLTREIFEGTVAPISFRDLLEKIMHRYPTLASDKVQGVIEQLLQQQYLTLTLQPSLLTESPFDDLLAKLSNTPAATESLQDVSEKIKKYNNTQLGEGEEALLSLKHAMENGIEIQNLIQVDTAYNQKGLTLSNAIAKELGLAAEVLWRIANDSSEYSLRTYHEKFLEKYGIYRVIPLMELLHEEGGLGVPEHYLKSSSEQTPTYRKESKWKKWLKHQWFQSINEGCKEIELTEAILNQMLEKADKNKAFPSFDLFCEIFANSSAKIDEGDFLLLVFSNSSQGGAAFGRFLDLFGEATKESLRSFLQEEESLEKESLFAQSSYLSYIPRNANVAIHPNLRGHSIDIGGSGDFSLEDIYVGVTPDRFYLTLKDQRQELIITTGSMLTNSVAPFPLRFICELSIERYKPIAPFSWMPLDDLPFFPRVRLKKTILSPAKWKVDLFQLGLTAKDPLPAVEKKFNAWAEQWKMPRYIFIGDGDQKILMDREHPAHIQEIINQIKKDKTVVFIEKIGQIEGEWVQSQRGKHLSEFVVPFIKNSKYAYVPHRFADTKQEAIASSDRWRLPGSEWLFAKCYLGAEHENRFLIDHFHNFTSYLLEKKIITDCFFVRYTDSKSHLRLRFRGDKERIISELLPSFHDWTHSLLQERCINEMTLSMYEREVERYGGETLIESAESLFCADSITSISLVNAILSKKTMLSEEVVGALSLIDFLQGLGLNLQQQIEFYSSLKLDKKELTGFREHKSSLTSLGGAILQNALMDHSQDGVALCEAFQRREIALHAFASQMQQSQSQKKLTVSPQMIKDSLIHMHCNRLLGRDPKKETKARLYAYNTLIAINEKLRRTGVVYTRIKNIL